MGKNKVPNIECSVLGGWGIRGKNYKHFREKSLSLGLAIV